MNRMKQKQRRETRQADLLQFIIGYKTANDGNSPTIAQMLKKLGYSSTSVVASDLDALEEDQKISRQYGDARNIIVTGGQWVYEGAGQ